MVVCCLNNSLTTACSGIVVLYKQKWLWRNVSLHILSTAKDFIPHDGDIKSSIFLHVCEFEFVLPKLSMVCQSSYLIKRPPNDRVKVISEIVLKIKMEYGFYVYFVGCCHIAFKEVFMFLGSMSTKVSVQWFHVLLNVIYLIWELNLQMHLNILIFSPNVELIMHHDLAEA